MRKTNRILVALVTLTVLLMANTIGVFALQNFTDVGDGHWAKDYVEKMENKGIVTGYPDATFRPSENVSKLATIVMIFRTIKAADKLNDVNIDSLVNKHNVVLYQYNIPTKYSWAKEAVAFALEKNIISQYELATFFKADGSLANATRSEVSIYLGKALNNYLDEELKSSVIIHFDFKDAEFISSTAAPYIDLLIRKDIVKGDENGNFNPKDPIIRAAVAKMFSVAFDILDDIEVQTEPKPTAKDLTTKEGKIVLIVDDNNSIIVETSEGDRTYHKVEDDTDIVINGKISDIDDLEEKQNVKLYLDEDGILVKAEVNENITELKGTVYNVLDMGGYHLLTVKDKNNKKKSYRIDSDTPVKLDDRTVSPLELDGGDTVSLVVDGEYAKEVIAQSMTRIYEGILESGIVFNEYPKLVIKTATQKVYELEVDDEAEVKRNNKKKTLMSLVKGDLVTITTEYDKVVKIVATSVKNEDVGVITEIILAKEHKITILNEDDEKITYTLSPDVDIEVDNKNATIYDLKIDYKVELKIESDVVKDIEAEKVETSNSLTGIITEIYKDFEAIRIKVNEGGETKYYSVSADNAEIITLSGRARSFRDLDEDDEVVVYGKAQNEIFDFVADNIVIIKEN